ncbi:MAG: VPLPA-CTERM sorting domain-containing protein [Pseudomonadota bacterium]
MKKLFMFKNLFIIFVCCILFLGTEETSEGAIIIDQQAPYYDGNPISYKSDNFYWQQGVTAGNSGKLYSIDLFLFTSDVIDITLFSGIPWQTSSPVFETSFSPTSGVWNNIDVSSADFMVDVGTQFTIMLHGSDPNTSLAGNSWGYSGGSLWFVSGSNAPWENNWDLAFNTYVETSAVPIPAAAFLFGSGLIGLIGIRRRSNKQ